MKPRELVIDSFAGGGGASLGISWALGRGPDIAINHDREAIAMHEANHPESRHYREDVWDVDPLEATGGQPVGAVWLSPDCKHHSKASNGKPKSRRVRGLAWVAFRWAKAVRPRMIFLENVEEFAEWGPLYPSDHPNPRLRDQPIPEKKAKTFRLFCNRLRGLGYEVQHRELRGSDFGAPTSRNRLLLIARCDGEPIVWPRPTHGRHAAPVRIAGDCVDWSIPNPSIFDRQPPLVPNTLRRIGRGIGRFVLNADRPYIAHAAVPGGQDRRELAAAFLSLNYEGNYRGAGLSLFQPAATITTKDHHSLITVTLDGAVDRSAEVRAFLSVYYGTQQNTGDLFQPAPTLTTKDRLALVTVESLGRVITDITHRMLVPREQFRMQGFPDSYVIDVQYVDKKGKLRWLAKTAQTRMVGNSVCPHMAEAVVRANYVVDAAQVAA